MQIWFHDSRVKRMISFSSCALCYMYLICLSLSPNFLGLPNCYLNYQENIHQRIQIGCSALSEQDKGQPLVWTIPEVCVSQRIFTIVRYQKKWADDAENHTNTNISSCVLSIKAKRMLLLPSCQSAKAQRGAFCFWQRWGGRDQIYLPSWNYQKFTQNR